MKHYHVLVGLRGFYMPDSNYIVASIKLAKSLARYEANDWNESDRDPMKQYSPGQYYSKHNSITCNGPCFDDCKEEV